VEFRVDKTSDLPAPIGKVSFDVNNLLVNFSSFMDAVKKARPAAAKGTYIKRVTLTSTMGPGILVDPLLSQQTESE